MNNYALESDILDRFDFWIKILLIYIESDKISEIYDITDQNRIRKVPNQIWNFKLPEQYQIP